MFKWFWTIFSLGAPALRCSRCLISSRRSRSRGFFGVKSSPARIYSRLLNSAFLCLLFCSICIRNRLRVTDSKHCFADDEWTSQLFMNTLVIDGKSLSVKCYMLPRNKKRAVTQTTVWRYGVHHRIDERCEFSSLETKRGPRTARDVIINSLRSALREELSSLLPVGTSRGTIEYIREGCHERITMAHCPSFESRRF